MNYFACGFVVISDRMWDNISRVDFPDETIDLLFHFPLAVEKYGGYAGSD